MANGNFAGGDGTPENPYLIEDAWDLDAVRNDLTASYKLISDIDLDISPFNEGEGWNPIGDNKTSSDGSRFRGSFNGNNHKIYNLFINRTNSDYQGLFGYLRWANIKNILLENVDVTGRNNIGGLTGYATSESTVSYCHSTGNIDGNELTGGVAGSFHGSVIEESYFKGSVSGIKNIGGLIGQSRNDSKILRCHFSGDVIGGQYSGGLIGYISHGINIERCNSTGSVNGGNSTGGLIGYATTNVTISLCYSKSQVIGNKDNGSIGGLVGYGYSNAVIEKSYTEGDVNGKGNNTGGVVGYLFAATVENCYSTGSINGVRRVGGLVGYDSMGNIINSYSMGIVVGNQEVGGIVGVIADSRSTILNSFWDIETSGQIASAGGVGLTTQEMQAAQTFIDAGWHEETLEDGTPVWILRDGRYPKLWFDITQYYSSEGQWESPIIDLGSGWYQTKLINIVSSSPGNTNLLIEIATSSDGNVFSEYQELDTQTPPQARYVKLRASLSADAQSGNDKTLIFDQSDIENMLNLTDFVEADGQLKLKTYQEQTQKEYVDLEDGKVFEHPINLSDWKSVKKIEVN